MTDITMPKLSDSMEEGTILSWLKATGELVAAGEDLVEIETDKATITHTAETAGVLQEILVAEGASAAIGEPIARIGTPAEASVAPSSPPASAAAPAATGSETPAGSSSVIMTSAAARPVNGDRNGEAGIKVTPLARRVAAVHGVSLAGLEGTGPLGRITRADVLKKAGIVDQLAAEGVEKPAVEQPANEPAVQRESQAANLRQPTPLQQVVARRMTEAKATIPHFQVQTEVVMDAAIALRANLKAVAGEGHVVPSFNDIVIKAAAVALREHPLANGSYTDAGFALHDAVNVGMAVAGDGALVVPTVFDAAGKSLGQIARDTRTLAQRVRAGAITPPELEAATFTVSNLGMFGMTAITPVINPPQSAILGVGALRHVLARVDGEIVDRTLLTLTLSCDHRILYGADAARFLARIRELLEAPLTLAL
jgi:pyruvate dehydrogenase E2 component (dihydrolipoamide acetyltransferase)